MSDTDWNRNLDGAVGRYQPEDEYFHGTGPAGDRINSDQRAKGKAASSRFTGAFRWPAALMPAVWANEPLASFGEKR